MGDALSPVLYSANPWLATDIAMRYRGGKHFAWCCEHYDIAKAPSGSAAALIAPSSNPREIYEMLQRAVVREDEHSSLLRSYRKTFKRLALTWHANNEINEAQRDEIFAALKPGSWRIWRPVLYVIPRAPIENAGRLIEVPRTDRAGYGPELQIQALMRHEFDIIELA
jgi:hypothetical protein